MVFLSPPGYKQKNIYKLAFLLFCFFNQFVKAIEKVQNYNTENGKMK